MEKTARSTGTGEPAPPGWLGGSTQLADAGRWRAIAVETATDMPSMHRAVRRLRGEFAGLDLGTAVRALAALAEGSPTLARLTQCDLEAVQTFRAAGVDVPDEVMSLFPPERGAVRAVESQGSWLLDGTQLGGVHPGSVDRMVVLAATDEGDRLFTASTHADGVLRDRTPGAAAVQQNGPVTFTAVPATPVGSANGWAGERPTFDGMLLDATCWFGSCVWLCRAVESTLAAQRDTADLLRAGRVDVWVYSARMAMRDAVLIVEVDPTSRAAELAARRVMAVTAMTVDRVIREVALLSDSRVRYQDVPVPARVAQLQVALRRFDADANLRALGELVAGAD